MPARRANVVRTSKVPRKCPRVTGVFHFDKQTPDLQDFCEAL
jgi:hypothetical protein